MQVIRLRYWDHIHSQLFIIKMNEMLALMSGNSIIIEPIIINRSALYRTQNVPDLCLIALCLPKLSL